MVISQLSNHFQQLMNLLIIWPESFWLFMIQEKDGLLEKTNKKLKKEKLKE